MLNGSRACTCVRRRGGNAVCSLWRSSKFKGRLPCSYVCQKTFLGCISGIVSLWTSKIDRGRFDLMLQFIHLLCPGNDVCLSQGTVIVIRGEGPKGGPGMPEMLTPTSAVIGAGLGKVTPSNFTLWYPIYLMSIQYWFSYKYLCDVKSLSYSYYLTWAAGSCTFNRWPLLWWISWIRCWPHLSWGTGTCWSKLMTCFGLSSTVL